MAINFPSSPILDQIFTSDNTSFIWNGTAWVGYSTSFVVNYNASSIVIKDDGSSVGAAGTIDFGSNLSVSFSSGVATVTGSASGSSSQFVTTAAGIHTLSNVGIGTTNPTSALTVTGNGTFTGVVTATTFVGALTGTATTATNAQGLTGTPNITVGVVTASRFNVGTGGTVITTTTAGLVGIGTTNPTTALTVVGASGTTLLVTGGTIPIQIGGNGVSGTIFKVGEINLSGPDVSDVNATYFSNILYSKVGDFRYNLEFHSGGYTGYGGAAPAGGPGDFIFYKRDTGYGRAERFRISGETGNITAQGGVIAASANVSGISTLGTVQISSGIVTATSGIVTYYGDTSNATDGRWTLGASGTNDYTFTGIGFTQTTNDPVLYLARGRVYEFVNNSGGGHPFEIRTSNNGSAYSDGVTNNSAASGVIRFEIPFNAPNTLYYQCTNHSGMGNTISVYPSTL